MTKREFFTKLVPWSYVEAAERTGFDRMKFLFVASVSLIGLFLMFWSGERDETIKQVSAWLLYTLPAVLAAFSVVVLWVAVGAIRHFKSDPGAFRFEAIEANNFAERFSRDVDVIDGGEF
jgi:hypothetical protein